MNNLLSYCGLVNVRINASERDLPVNISIELIIFLAPIYTKVATVFTMADKAHPSP